MFDFPRRRLFKGEIPIRMDDTDFMDELAKNLEIEVDAPESPGDFVKWAIQKTIDEGRIKRKKDQIRRLENRIGTTNENV